MQDLKIYLTLGLSAAFATTVLAQNTEHTVAFKVSAENPMRYLGITADGTVNIQATEGTKTQNFTLIDSNGGDLGDGDDVQIKQYKYLCEKGDTVSRTSRPDQSTHFKIKKTNTGISLQTASGGFVSVKTFKGPLNTTGAADKALVFEVVENPAVPEANAAPTKSTAVLNPLPTLANVAYGEHQRQVLDFWKAPSDKPTPLVFYIHGGGWVRGDKNEVSGVQNYLTAGISVVSINYRYSWQAQLAGVNPPVAWPLHDAARALQFVRFKAQEWNIDKQRIAASGQSAGACSSLWLAFHDDLADPKSNDPVSRESTRLWCAAVDIAQTSLDPQQMQEWTPNSRYGGHAFGFMDPNDLKTRDTRFAEFLEHRQEVLPWIKEYSPIEHTSPDDPPTYLHYKIPPGLGKPQPDPTHTANFGVKLQEKLTELGVPCELAYPGTPAVKHTGIRDFLIETLSH